MTNSVAVANKFADYFVICGLEPSCGLEPDKLSGDSLHIQPLDRPFKSQVLAHYPENVPWNRFDKDAVGMLCCPRGLTFRTQKQQRKPSFHSFLITREDGSRIYGTAYTFFEEVTNHQICAAMQTLHAMHLAELSNSQSRTLYSHLGPVHERSPVQGRRRNTYKAYDISQDKLYSTKCICVISQVPFVAAMRKFLMSLYNTTQSFSAPDLPLESYVYNILHEVPMPPPGRSLKFSCMGREIGCQRPNVNELPLLDMPIGEIFRMLGIKNVMAIFTCILLEHQILLYSTNYYYLMLVAEGLTSLLFPFSWQHVYVPILPASLLHFLDAPVPFIMGLHHGHEDRSELALPSEANMCFVDIDAGIVELPEDLPQFPQQHELVEEIQTILTKFGSRYASKDSVFHDDYDSGMSDGSVSSSLTSIPNKMEILAQSEAFTKIAAIAKRSGVINSLDDIELNLDSNKSSKRNSRNEDLDESSRELEDLKFNNAIRQVFLNRFLHIFCHYEHFVIQPVGQNVESWLTNRDSVQNFDKASFLSDQPDTHLPFLAAFIETQMFTTLIDNKILSIWEEPDLALKVFEARLKTISEREEGQTPVYHRCISYEDTESVIEKRVHHIDLIASTPHRLEFMNEVTQHQRGVFPILQSAVLNREPLSNKPKKHENAKWRKKERQAQHVEHIGLKAAQREKFIQEAKSRRIRESKLFDTNPTMVARTNWKFVETLLKECKNKTKRMLVEKMGQEAVDLGHGELSITGVEENTLIASLCDLLERIWSHGLQSKQGKSALWSHLLSFKEIEDCHDTNKPIDPNKLTPGTPLEMSLEDLSATLEANSPLGSPSKTRHKRKNSQSVNLPTLPVLSTSLTADMRNVQGMTDIKTDAGYARAWIRLSLEKKVLSKHLKELLSDTDLTRSLYKRYAFLRCEDEKEQFLYHMLSLNAVDYKCFTNSFTNTVIPYRVLVFPAKRIGGSICGTSANPWISVAGQLGESASTPIPKASWELLLECKNLGVLTTVRIGHDNAGLAPRWLVEHVLIRNEITGHTFKFPCGRWLGKGADDGSLERLLVGELVPMTTDTEELLTTCSTPPRCGSPSTPRKSSETKLSICRIQELVGDSVNNLVKHFYKPEKERGSLTVLLCGENGLVSCMEHVFQYNFKSARLFRNKFYLWDYIEKIQAYYETLLRDEQKIPTALKTVYKSLCYLVDKINNSSQNIGKDGKFQLLICLAIRDNLLQRWIPAIVDTPVTTSMYEEVSFLRDPELTTFLVHILDSLKEFNITLEASLTKGIDA